MKELLLLLAAAVAALGYVSYQNIEKDKALKAAQEQVAQVQSQEAQLKRDLHDATERLRVAKVPITGAPATPKPSWIQNEIESRKGALDVSEKAEKAGKDRR